MASSAAPAETASATATATATTPPPPPPLPADFTAAADARKTADGNLKTLLAKDGKCDALAAEITKFSKENAAAYQKFTAEWGKLTDDQKKQATDGGITSTPPDTSATSGGMKTCVDKKDKKVTAALAAFTKEAEKAPSAAPGTAPKGSAAPKGGTAPKKK